MWKKGPLPEGTFDYGGVALHSAGEDPKTLGKYGFNFADFRGNHVMLYKDGEGYVERHEAWEVAMYNNCLASPTKEELAQ